MLILSHYVRGGKDLASQSMSFGLWICGIQPVWLPMGLEIWQWDKRFLVMAPRMTAINAAAVHPTAKFLASWAGFRALIHVFCPLGQEIGWQEQQQLLWV